MLSRLDAMTDTNSQVIEPALDAIEAEETEKVESPNADSSPAAADTGETPNPKRKSGAEARIDELTRLRYDAERERDHWRQMAMRQNTPQNAEPAAEPPKPKAAPTLQDFNYDETAYQAALLEHLKADAARVARETLQQERDREREETRRNTFKQRESDFSKTNPDYLVVTRDPSLPFTKELVQLASESTLGPEVLYYLAKNRDLAESIAGMSPVAQARELGRIEAKLEKPAAPPAPKPAVSQAPPPAPRIEAVEPSMSVSTTSADSDQMSDDEWYKAEMKRLSKRKKAK